MVVRSCSTTVIDTARTGAPYTLSKAAMNTYVSVAYLMALSVVQTMPGEY
jgi:hypothetical protein